MGGFGGLGGSVGWDGWRDCWATMFCDDIGVRGRRGVGGLAGQEARWGRICGGPWRV